MRHVRQFLYLMAICLPVMFITSCSEDDEEDYGTSTTRDQQGGESGRTNVPNNQIWYEASEKLKETASDLYATCLHTNVFNATIISHTFSNGKGIITFDAAVTTIGEGAFYGCSSLTSINIPNSVTKIGSSAFGHCKGLTSVTIGNSVTSIGGSAFESCTSLTNIEIPNSVTYIGEWAFCECNCGA